MTDRLSRLEFHPTPTPDPDVLECELDVLGRWYGDTRELIEEAYGPYADTTVFLSVRDPDGVVQGFTRLIRPGPLPLKTVADVGRPPWSVDGARAAAAAGVDLSRAWDVATIGVRKELGSSGAVVAAALYHGVITATRVNDVPWIVAVIDERVRKMLAGVGLALHALPGTAPSRYMGSAACAPVYAHMGRMVDEQRRNFPEAYRLITLGTGLDGVSVPPPQAYRLATPVAPERVDLRGAEPHVVDLSDAEHRRIDLPGDGPADPARAAERSA